MKTITKMSLAILLSVSASFALADAQQVLQQRLEKITNYSAKFTQRVTSSKGKMIQNGTGNFKVKRPDLFRLDTVKPEETSLISDGDTLWYYDPFVQQVTARDVEDAVNNTPFVLLTSSNSSNWGKYTVTQSSNTFTLKPKSKQSAIKQFTIYIDPNGTIRNFSSTNREGQINSYMLNYTSTKPLSNATFDFKVPKGVELDDQR